MSYGMPLALWGNRVCDRKQARIDIQPVQRIRAHEEVVRQLRALMEREVLRTGDRLPSERELAKQFGVSRVTVRQALSVLQAMGLIESRIGNGTFARAGHKALSVTDLASALRVAQGNLTEQLELRRIIEPQVACLAAERATDADLDDPLRYISLQEARLSEGVPFVEEDGAFHLAIAQATKNSLLVKMVEGIQELLWESHEHSLRVPGGMQLSGGTYPREPGDTGSRSSGRLRRNARPHTRRGASDPPTTRSQRGRSRSEGFGELELPIQSGVKKLPAMSRRLSTLLVFGLPMRDTGG